MHARPSYVTRWWMCCRYITHVWLWTTSIKKYTSGSNNVTMPTEDMDPSHTHMYGKQQRGNVSIDSEQANACLSSLGQLTMSSIKTKKCIIAPTPYLAGTL